MASRITVCCFLLAITLFTACLQGTVGIDLGLGFIKEPEDVVAKRNQPVMLDCSAFSNNEYGHVNVTWYHKGVLVNDPRRQILNNGSLYIRRIRYRKHNGSSSGGGGGGGGSSSGLGSATGNSEGSDTGKYHCAIRNDLGTLVSRPAHIYIATMSKKFTLDPKSVFVEEGDVAQFRCQIQGFPSPTYIWQKNQNTSQDGGESWIIIPQVDSRFTIFNTGILQINGVATHDAGNYRCVAVNDEHNQSSAEATLNVIPATKLYRPPSFILTDPSVTVVEGETAILPCLATGYPSPGISWSRQDRRKIRTNVTDMIGQGNLILHGTLYEDVGIYVCTASNKPENSMEINSVVQVVKLIVLRPPRILGETQSVVGPLGKTARFVCKTDGIPPPTIKWMKDGRVVDASGRIRQKMNPNNELVIMQTITADSGFYQCMAENSVGYASVAVLLQVSTSHSQPDPPSNLQAITRSNTSIELSWDAPKSRNGLHIQAYTVHYYKSGGEETQTISANTSCVITKLEPYTNYTFYVRAYNALSASDQSKSITWTTGEDVPLAAPSVTLRSLSMTSLYVIWKELPPSVARGVVVKYKLHWRKRNHPYTDIVQVPGNITEYTLTGLRPGKAYDVRVLAATKVGYPVLKDEKWPWVIHEMPDDVTSHVPLAPKLHCVSNKTAVKIQWELPEDNEYDATSYNISYQKQGNRVWKSFVVPGNVTEFFFTDLEPGTVYDVRVFGSNANGNGPHAVFTLVDTLQDGQVSNPGAEAPTHLEAYSVKSTAIRLKWKSPVANKTISYYTIRYNPVGNISSDNASWVNYIRSNNEEVCITDLRPYTQYEFSVSSHVLNHSQGSYSDKVKCKTLEDVPSCPRDVDWKALDSQSIRVSWQPPQYPNGIITGYDIMYNTDGGDISLIDKWDIVQQNGNESSYIINNLAKNTLYYLFVRAKTIAGQGPPTDIMSFNTRDMHYTNNSAIPPKFQDPKVGIIVGVSIGVCCIIICGLIIACRNRCFPPLTDHHSLHSNNHWSNRYSPRMNGSAHLSRDYCLSCSESHEMDSVAPMLKHIPDTVSSHLDTKGGYAVSLPYVNGQVEQQKSRNGNRYSNGHAGQHLLINITENPQFEISKDLLQGDGNKCKSNTRLLNGSPSSVAPLLDRSSDKNVNSPENPSNAMVQNQVTSNHHIRGQPASNGHSQRNGHHGQHHHNSNGAHRHHRSHGHTHHHTHGAKRGKRNSGVTSGSSLKSECFYPVANMFSISLTPLHSSTPSAEMQSGSTFTASSAIVTIPPGNGKQSSKLGRRQRPLSHTAISAVPNNVGASSYSKSSPSVVSGANQGNVEQSPSKLQQFGQHDIVISGQQDAQPQHSDTHNPRRHNQMPSYPSTSSPSSSASSSSSSSSSSPTDSHLPNANSHKSLAPT